MNSSAFTALDYDVSYIYTDADIVGAESNMLSLRWDGVWMRSFDAVIAPSNNLLTSLGYKVIPSNMDWMGGGSSALPITLKSFEVTSIGNIAKIDWVTASEFNSDYFTVERSRDGLNFNILATITGAGSTSSETSYSLIDDQPLDGTSYYRLTQTDFDGTSETFNIVALNRINTTIDFTVHPNPSNGRDITLSFNNAGNDEVLVVLYNIMGEQVYSKIAVLDNGSAVIAIDSEKKLAPGVYLIIGSSDEAIYQKKLIVQ